ncbi:hypothetical protein [Pseudonocardia kunmingensis]|uniref:Uncharacterized protein n=1 Tax=Pseudonocardia kunmingensis TaxID=630975 RepID=A0A543CX53_9PSEU|nr:hypothetical protein [Pseudonocardia kunmingensis]TQM01694.1 hypothetical protein FB558_8595 [Pseudonocardia kunmingensis]
MEPTIKKDWIQTLRDNPQRQGRSHLAAIHTDGVERRCCLGELCELAVAAGIIGRREVEHTTALIHHPGLNPVTVVIYGRPGDESTMSLPIAVAEWAGLDSCDPDIAPELPASQANDDRRMTFAAIAEAIEDYR